MEAGILGTVDGQFDELESFQSTTTQDDTELQRCIEVRRALSLPNRVTAYEGRAAMERLNEQEDVQIDEGEITVYERPQRVTSYTPFLAVPGEAVIVGNGAGTFAFDLIGSQTNTTIGRAELDLGSFVSDFEEVDPWQVGFYGSLGNAENGVVYGNQLLEDEELAGLLGDSNINQLGLEFTYDDAMIKMRMSESGYIEVYQPSSYESEEYLQFVLDEILPYIE